MSITTAGDLLTRVSDYLRRIGDTAFEARMPDLVFAAEKRIEATASLMELRGVSTLNIAANAAATVMPADLVDLYGVTLVTPVRRPLPAFEFNAFQSEFALSPAATPVAYSVFGRSLYWGPNPSVACTAQIAYQRRIAYLDLHNPASTNDVIAAHGHIYLYATLVEAALTLGGMEGADAWGMKFAGALQSAIDNATTAGWSSVANTQARPVQFGKKGVSA